MKEKLVVTLALTPALSHPMGEGELLSVSLKFARLDLPGGLSQKESGAERAALQTLARFTADLEWREASGVRRVHRRFF